jgi:hypothetical protein
MHAIANYILRGRLQAIGITSFLTIISLLVPALAYLISGLPVTLVTLRRGPLIGIQVVAGSLLLTLGLTYIVGVIPQVALAFSVGVWLPVWCCAVVLRTTRSQGLMALAAAGIGLLFILFMHLVIGDVTAWWKSWLELWIQSNLSAATGEQYKQIVNVVTPLMNAIMAALIMLSIILTTLAGRWWQALLFNPGGFRPEFYALGFPRVLCYLTVLGVVILFIIGEQQKSILRDALVLVIFLYMFQGLSAIHRTVQRRKLSVAWLGIMYCLLILLPQMVLFISCIGMVDSWMKGGRPREGSAGQ